MRLPFIFVFLIIHFCSVGQTHSLSLAAGRNRIDYLIGTKYSFKLNRNEFSGGLEVGISRTFVQGRLNPRATVGYGYFAVEKEKLSFAPTIHYAISRLRISKSPAADIRYHEYLGGYSFEYGRKWRLVHQLLFGAMSEVFRNQNTQQKELFWSFGYCATFGIKYRL